MVILYVLKEHYHFHRKRQDSVSWTEKENSKISRNHFDKHILELSLRSLNSIKRKNSLVSKLNKLYKPIRSKLFRAYFSVLKVFNIFWFFNIYKATYFVQKFHFEFFDATILNKSGSFVMSSTP